MEACVGSGGRQLLTAKQGDGWSLGQCQPWDPSPCPTPGARGTSLGSAVLVWAWIRDPGSDQASDSIALTHTPRGMLRREHHLGNAPEHCLYKSGCYPLFLFVFPGPSSQQGFFNPFPPLCPPRRRSCSGCEAEAAPGDRGTPA